MPRASKNPAGALGSHSSSSRRPAVVSGETVGAYERPLSFSTMRTDVPEDTDVVEGLVGEAAGQGAVADDRHHPPRLRAAAGPPAAMP